MKRKLLTAIIFLWNVYIMCAQSFSTGLYFEDSQGRKDTIMIGYSANATFEIDDEFDELDIKDTPRDNFDIRCIDFDFSNIDEGYLYEICEFPEINGGLFHYEDILNYESKVKIDKGDCTSSPPSPWWYTPIIFTIPKEASFPIEIAWNANDFAMACHELSFFSEVPPPWFGEIHDFCGGDLVHDMVSLVDSTQIILESPSPFSIMERDSTFQSVYYLYLHFNDELSSIRRLIKSKIYLASYLTLPVDHLL